MKLYIDPGTGSMLFAILIGIIGALNYLVRKWIVKLRFILGGGKGETTDTQRLPMVIFSDDKRYWRNFEPVCRELDKRGMEVKYITASPDDPALNNPYPHIHAEYVGPGNKVFARMNFINADIVLSTTPGLEVYQWKRSKDAAWYVHMLHMSNDPTLYRMFGTDFYDAVLLSGDYQVKQLRELEQLRNLPAKELVQVGIPYMDDMAARLAAAEKTVSDRKTVLLAPSWGKSAILAKYGSRIFDALLKTDYNIVVRPHPQSFTSEKEMIDALMAKYPDSDRLQWNRDVDNFEVLKNSDIMISDFSGVVFEFSLVYDKPIIYADTDFDKSPYDAWWLDETPWTFTALPRLGVELNEENLDKLPEMIDSCLNDSRYAQDRQQVCRETWAYPGEGAVRVADYLMEKYESLKSKESKE